jgi:hypothetical protein
MPGLGARIRAPFLAERSAIGTIDGPMERRHLRYFVAVAEALNFTKAAGCLRVAQRAKAQVTEVAGSHAIYVSKPAEIAEFIRQAAGASAQVRN